MKKLILVIMVLILFLSSFSWTYAASASPKEEVVYGLLNHDGSVQNLYIVNIFDGGTIIDYGNYEKVKNLTGSEPITMTGDMITVNTNSEKFYYQGYITSKELPWNIEVKYFIGAEEVTGDVLAGMSGKLKITVSVTQNMNVDSSFFENYGLQIALTFDNRLCSEINADKATIAEAGGKKQINFTVLPGNDFEGTITALVNDFEMDSITVNAVRLNFDFDINTSEYFSNLSELIKGIEELDEGAEKLSDAVKEISDGIDEYTNGLKAFKEGLHQVSAGAEDIHNGVKALSMGLTELTSQNDQLINGANALQQAAFEAVNLQLSIMSLNIPSLTPENYDLILSDIPELKVLKDQLDSIVQFIDGIKGYTDAAATIKNGADELLKGTEKFKDSAGEITSAADVIYDGAVKINEGISALYDGISEYKKGTGEFKSNTSDLDNKINEEINKLMDEMFGKDKTVKSFASDKNTEIKSVQFVLRTEPIKIKSLTVAETIKPVKLIFWQKLLKLFGLLK